MSLTPRYMSWGRGSSGGGGGGGVVRSHSQEKQQSSNRLVLHIQFYCHVF